MAKSSRINATICLPRLNSFDALEKKFFTNLEYPIMSPVAFEWIKNTKVQTIDDLVIFLKTKFPNAIILTEEQYTKFYNKLKKIKL